MWKRKWRSSLTNTSTPDQLSECRGDPEWEKHYDIAGVVVCRECGAKLRSALCGGTFHLGRVHGLTRKDYLAKYPGAPWSTAERAAGQNRAQQNRMAKPENRQRKKDNAKVWRKNHPDAIKARRAKENAKPKNQQKKKELWAEMKAELRRARCEKLLSGRRAWMQTAGKYLLDHPDAMNGEVAKHLDSIGLLRKDGKRWVEAIRGDSVTNDFGDLRKLLGIRGHIFRRTKSVKSFVALT
jgi:hypothetical protein